jgi:hypothetical protein
LISETARRSLLAAVMAAALTIGACGGNSEPQTAVGKPSPTPPGSISLGELRSCLKSAGLEVIARGGAAREGGEPVRYLQVAVRRHPTPAGPIYDRVVLSVFDSAAEATTALEGIPPDGGTAGIQPVQVGNVLKSVSNSTLVAGDRPPPPEKDAAIDGCLPLE